MSKVCKVFAISNEDIKAYNNSEKSEDKFIPNYDYAIITFIDRCLFVSYIKDRENVFQGKYAHGTYPVLDGDFVIIDSCLTKQPELKEEPLFQVGDRVYDWHCGWMTITEIKSHGSIFTVCDKKQKPHNFFGEHIVRLSFTEYNFVNGGWSQERPKPLPKVGDWGWFWDDGDLEEEHSIYGKLLNIDTSHHSQKYYVGDVWVKYFSTENPFEKK